MRVPGLWRLKALYKRINPTEPVKIFSCPVCGNMVADFERLSDSYIKHFDDNLHIHPFYAYETLNVFHYECPVCHAPDRERLYAIYLKRKFDELDKGRSYKMVEFAPSAGLSAFIRKHPFINYRTADLFMPGVDDVVDLTDMKMYADNSFDIFLCSHILEHIYDDKKAMAELFRILKPGGFGIAMVPILLTLDKTYENPAAQTEAERWKYFGQFDHVRIYSKPDFVSKLESAGFVVNQRDIHYFGAEVFEKCGLHKRSILYEVQKPLR